jgi:hypothetical protein
LGHHANHPEMADLQFHNSNVMGWWDSCLPSGASKL